MPGQIYVPANSRVAASYIGIRHIPFQSALLIYFLLRESSSCERVASAMFPRKSTLAGVKKLIFHSDPKALFRVIFRGQYSRIWGRVGFLACFTISRSLGV
jgi:hypothetical protein